MYNDTASFLKFRNKLRMERKCRVYKDSTIKALLSERVQASSAVVQARPDPYNAFYRAAMVRTVATVILSAVLIAVGQSYLRRVMSAHTLPPWSIGLLTVVPILTLILTTVFLLQKMYSVRVADKHQSDWLCARLMATTTTAVIALTGTIIASLHLPVLMMLFMLPKRYPPNQRPTTARVVLSLLIVSLFVLALWEWFDVHTLVQRTATQQTRQEGVREVVYAYVPDDNWYEESCRSKIVARVKRVTNRLSTPTDSSIVLMMHRLQTIVAYATRHMLLSQVARRNLPGLEPCALHVMLWQPSQKYFSTQWLVRFTSTKTVSFVNDDGADFNFVDPRDWWLTYYQIVLDYFQGQDDQVNPHYLAILLNTNIVMSTNIKITSTNESWESLTLLDNESDLLREEKSRFGSADTMAAITILAAHIFAMTMTKSTAERPIASDTLVQSMLSAPLLVKILLQEFKTYLRDSFSSGQLLSHTVKALLNNLVVKFANKSKEERSAFFTAHKGLYEIWRTITRNLVPSCTSLNASLLAMQPNSDPFYGPMTSFSDLAPFHRFRYRWEAENDTEKADTIAQTLHVLNRALSPVTPRSSPRGGGAP